MVAKEIPLEARKLLVRVALAGSVRKDTGPFGGRDGQELFGKGSTVAQNPLERMYIRKPVAKLTGSELFQHTNGASFSVLDFWRYGFSNLNSNVLRGALAEFLVEAALKDVADITIRNPWGDSDVEYHGTTIEVKSCSYLQDWDQKTLSTILWSGLKAQRLYWSSAVSETPTKEPPTYKSDVYVLALLSHQDSATLDILDLNQWRFFVLSQDELRDVSGDKSSVSLARLTKHGIESVPFAELKERIEARATARAS